MHKRDITSSMPMEYLPMKDGTAYDIGKTLAISGGVADLAIGTTVPTYICAGKATGTTGGFIPAHRVEKDIVYIAPLSADGAALKIGDKVTISADAIAVTATTASGIAEIVGFSTEAKAVGDDVYVRL